MNANTNIQGIPPNQLVPGKYYDVYEYGVFIAPKKFKKIDNQGFVHFDAGSGMSMGFNPINSVFRDSIGSTAAPAAPPSTRPPNGGKKTKRRRNKKRKTISRKRELTRFKINAI
jgi:hypothetical protein